MRITIRLEGKDGTLHAEGRIDADSIYERHLVERNRHVYAYKHASRMGLTATFVECDPPIVITEF